jgi:hypothetical protein
MYGAEDHHSLRAEVVALLRKDAVLSNNSICVPSHRDYHMAETWNKG